MDSSSTETHLSLDRAREQGRGRNADHPTKVPRRGWKDILLRTGKKILTDRVPMISAGVTYYLLLALVPALTAFVSLYGLFNDPASVSHHVDMLRSIVPAGGMSIIDDQLTRLTEQGAPTLGLALVVSLTIALWSASAGVKALFEAMNIAYEEREKRNFFHLSVLGLAFTLAGVVGAAAMLAVVVIIPLVLSLFGFGEGFEWLVQGAGYAVLAVVLYCGVLVLYRYGPSRELARWRWVRPGALVALALILVVSLLFSWYAANFANYDKTYGSLGALIGLLTWMWICMLLLIAGAELNAEIEHQTVEDTTTGRPQPLGLRNARMADTVGKSATEVDEDSFEDKSTDWKLGYEAAMRRRTRGPGPRLSPNYLLPAAVASLLLERRARRKGR